jgi:hypothetical protein
VHNSQRARPTNFVARALLEVLEVLEVLVLARPVDFVVHVLSEVARPDRPLKSAAKVLLEAAVLAYHSVGLALVLFLVRGTPLPSPALRTTLNLGHRCATWTLNVECEVNAMIENGILRTTGSALEESQAILE